MLAEQGFPLNYFKRTSYKTTSTSADLSDHHPNNYVYCYEIEAKEKAVKCHLDCPSMHDKCTYLFVLIWNQDYRPIAPSTITVYTNSLWELL